MESNRHSYDDHSAEEGYIDMDLNSQSIIFIHTKITSPQFEFQMSTTSSSEINFTVPSPADELFYKGKLLPLHLPPRLQMVEKLLQNTSTYEYKLSNTIDIDSFTTTTVAATPLFSATNNSPADNNTPFESCTISPIDSLQVSRELNPEEEYFSSYKTVGEIENQKKSWTKKLSIGSKLKASRSYLKSLFYKSKEKYSEEEANFNKNKESSDNKYAKEGSKKNPFGQIQRISKQETCAENMKKEGDSHSHSHSHRRSFSGVFKRISMPRSSSSIYSNGFIEKQKKNTLKRSNSVGSDIENPIQAAIAHCKKSQERLHHSRKALSEMGFCKLSTAALVVKYEDQRPTVCRG